MTTRRKTTGFTLIELLVAIAIIGVLMGLLSTGISQSRQRAKERARETDVQTLAASVRSYFHEYGEWPYGGIETMGSVSLVEDNYKVLEYLDHTNADKNERSIRFLNFAEYFTLNKDASSDEYELNERVPLDLYLGNLEDQPVVDPWGNPYTFTINFDYKTVTVESGGVKKQF